MPADLSLSIPLHALCGMLASGSREASRAWHEIEGTVHDAFGTRADALAGAMRGSNRRAALAAAEELVGAVQEEAPASPVAAESAELQRAREMVTELEAFTYSISHDLRAPLNSITCFAQAVQATESPRMSDEGRHRLDRVVQCALRMGRMIDDVLACSRAERSELRLHEVDLGELARGVVEEMGPCHPRAQVVIGPLPTVPGDGVLLRQVFANLVGNALKFSGANTAPRIEIEAVESASEVEILVHDNGAGFDAAYASRLFGLFQRLHTEREFPGTGVGLAIVKRIVTRHGGSVRAESNPGVRTTFAFTLPKPSHEIRAH